MKDLIERRETIEHIKKRLVETALNNVGFHEDVYLDIADNRIETWVNEVQPLVRIKEIPDVPDINVVKCKDCASHESCWYEVGQGNDGFCSLGKKKIQQ